MAKKIISLILFVSFGFALIPECFAQKDKKPEVIKENPKPTPKPPPPPPPKKP